ncbi:MAG: type III pantothenate kinase [Ignavibacteria bacterium]|nr:type III pantothenate kinase [Ignavibacteria bacterium]
MLLAIDIGNTHTVLGIFQNKKLIAHWRVSSPVLRTEDEIFLLVKNLCEHSKINTKKIDSVGIASVVPNLTDVYERMAKKYFHKEPLLISASLHFGIKIHYDDPNAVGADRLCNALAAFTKYKTACIVIDFGTATTYDVIAKNGDYLGGVITAGLETIASELHRRAAKLPKVELHFPETAIGRNTVTSMQAGIMFGAVDALEGMIRRLKIEIGNAKVIATGGLASIVSSQTNVIDVIEPWLVLEGIRLIGERIKKNKR